MTQTGRSALIINTAREPSGCPQCRRVFDWLERSESCEIEKSACEGPPLAMPAARNLAVVHYSRLGIKACKSEWNDARLLVVVCSRENTGADDVPTAVSLADDFVYCSTAPAELNLRIDRLLQPTRARSGGGDREKAMLRRALLNESEILGAADIELPKARSRELLARETLRRAKSLVIGDFERGYLSKLLAEHNGNISQAARAAGKDRRTLQRLVRKYSLKRESFKL